MFLYHFFQGVDPLAPVQDVFSSLWLLLGKPQAWPGNHPAPPASHFWRLKLWMEELLHQLIVYPIFINFLWGFNLFHPRWCRISSIHHITHFSTMLHRRMVRVRVPWWSGQPLLGLVQGRFAVPSVIHLGSLRVQVWYVFLIWAIPSPNTKPPPKYWTHQIRVRSFPLILDLKP